MENETIWFLEDLLDSALNESLDLEISLKNNELTAEKKELLCDFKNSWDLKIKELEDCIKWIKNMK